MSTRSEKDRQKQLQDKCQNLLTQMLRDEDNKYCVDCDAKGPRWASWNLGIFLCIRCAGIHRNLGVHISKVKSVNLDSWTPEQVVSLQQMGNSRARAVYEANLPDSFRRPQTDSALESFIRAKYESKKYIAQEWVPPPLPKVPIPVPKKIDVIPQALPKPHSSPKNRESKSGRNRDSSGSGGGGGAATDLLGLDTPTSEPPSTNEDVFTSFLSAAPVKKRSQEEESFFNQSLASPVGGVSGANATAQAQSGVGGKLTTDSILALYSKGPPIPAAVPSAYGGQPIQQFPYTSPPQPIPVAMMAPTGQPVSGNMNVGSNPFYSMQQQQAYQPQQQQNAVLPTHQQQLQQIEISQQLSGLNIGATNIATPPKYQNPPISNPLWQ